MGSVILNLLKTMNTSTKLIIFCYLIFSPTVFSAALPQFGGLEERTIETLITYLRWLLWVSLLGWQAIYSSAKQQLLLLLRPQHLPQQQQQQQHQERRSFRC